MATTHRPINPMKAKAPRIQAKRRAQRRGRAASTWRFSAVAGASVLGLSLMTRPAPAFADDTALIMGGTSIPTPPQSYVDAVDNLYLVPNGYGAYTPRP